MRPPRLKAPEDFPSAIYHCVSRVVDRQIVLHEAEKEQVDCISERNARPY